MNLISLIIIGLLLYLKLTNAIQISWLVLAALVVAVLFLFGGVQFKSLFGLNSSANSTLEQDACGCGPGQRVAISRRNFWGNYKSAGVVPCDTALSRIRASRKYRIDGCIN